jgi:hypothetical protein
MHALAVKIGLIVGLVIGGIAFVAGLVCGIKRKGWDFGWKCLKRWNIGK